VALEADEAAEETREGRAKSGIPEEGLPRTLFYLLGDICKRRAQFRICLAFIGMTTFLQRHNIWTHLERFNKKCTIKKRIRGIVFFLKQKPASRRVALKDVYKKTTQKE
jgi:hypothetical protein